MNAPLDMRPTLQTEMHRGYLAASRCGITMDALNYDLCIVHLSMAEEVKTPNADAFNLGLYLAAWRALDSKAQSDARLADNPYARAALPDDREGAAGDFRVVRGLQKRLSLTDVQVRGAAGALNDALAGQWNAYLAGRVR